VADIADGDSLGTNHVGFGSWVKISGGDPQQAGYFDLFDETHNVRGDSKTPLETDVKDKIAIPIVKEQSGMAAWNAMMKSKAKTLNELTKGQNTRPKEDNYNKNKVTKGTISILQGGGEATTNFVGWAPFAPASKSGESLANEEIELQKFHVIPKRASGTFPTEGLTKGDKEKLLKKIRELGAMKPLRTPKSKEGRELPLSTKVISTPLVHYYQSRYIASILKEQAKKATNPTQKEINRIPKMKTDLEKQLDNSIAFSPDDRTGVDAIFDMMPVPTNIRYPGRDKDAIANSDLMGAGGVDMGLLQKTYSLLTNPMRNRFNENVAKIIRSLPHDYNQPSMLQKKIFSLQPKMLEASLVWIEEIELQQAKTTVNINVGDVNYTMKTLETEVLPLNSTIAVPGWMILQFSNDVGKSILQTVNPYFNFKWEDRADENIGYEAILEQMEEENEDAAEDLVDSWYEVLGIRENIFDGTIVEMTTETIKIDFEGLLDGQTVIFDKDRFLENEWVDDEQDVFKSAYGFTGKRKMPKLGIKSSRAAWKYILDPTADRNEAEYGMPDFKEKFSFVPGTEEGLGVEVSYPGVIPDSDYTASDEGGYEASPDPVAEDIGLSRAFQALGIILMELVKKNGIELGLKEKSTSQFDKTVTALLGNYAQPGPATYHAQVHHALLYEVTHAAMRNASDSKGLVAMGQSMVFEQFSKNPAKLMCIWMLVELGLIDIGDISNEGVPQFFKIPRTTLERDLAEKPLMNALALIILSYYRLAFSPLRMRSKGGGVLGIDLKKQWPRLVSNAKSDPPEPFAFAAIMRFLASAEDKLEIDMPAWMPVLPDDIASQQRDRRKGEVVDFIQWSYGSNPLSVEAFCEVSAAFHAAKACSYYRPGNYAEMVARFIEAVEAERGEGFLMSVLMSYMPDKDGVKKLKLAPEPIPEGTIQFSEIKERVA